MPYGLLPCSQNSESTQTIYATYRSGIDHHSVGGVSSSDRDVRLQRFVSDLKGQNPMFVIIHAILVFVDLVVKTFTASFCISSSCSCSCCCETAQGSNRRLQKPSVSTGPFTRFGCFDRMTVKVELPRCCIFQVVFLRTELLDDATRSTPCCVPGRNGRRGGQGCDGDGDANGNANGNRDPSKNHHTPGTKKVVVKIHCPSGSGVWNFRRHSEWQNACSMNNGWLRFSTLQLYEWLIDYGALH
mmetsp:Transcript_18648/g.42597  ORF Transcript_18648/g.42597 Transcript_18648/m.42597 type:complete len:243 (+) Transcript_18648:17-745(+)